MAQQSIEVVLFGGSFNPPHMAHLFGACYLSSIGTFDKVVIMPVYKNQFGKKIAPYADRYEMCRMSMEWIPKVSVSDVERELGSSLTANTIKHLKELHPNWNMHFVVGTDAAKDIEDGKWENSEELLSMAKIFVFGRAGNKHENLNILPDISSTEIRASIASENHEVASTFLPDGVLDYITTNKLYRIENEF